MIDVLNVALVSMSPVIELRGGIPLGLALGMSPLLVYIVAVVFNFLAVPIILFFLDNVHSHLLKYGRYKAFFDNYIHSKRKKLEKSIGKRTEFIALMIFVAIPLPGTGAWTGTILAWFFGMKRIKVYLAILFGVILAGIIVMLASLGLIALF